MTTLSDLNRQYDLDTRARGFVKWVRLQAARHLARRSVMGDVPILDDGDPAVSTFEKAAVTAVTTQNTSALQREPSAYLAVAEAPTVLRRMLGWLPAPPFMPIAGILNDVEAQWVAEGAPAPLAPLTFASDTSAIAKFVFILAFATEWIRRADDRGLTMIDRRMGRSLRRIEDRLLLSDAAGVAGERPAGLLHGLTPFDDGSPSSLLATLAAMVAYVRDGDADRLFAITSPRAAVYLASLHANGVPMFPRAGINGGDIAGIPLIVTPAAGNKLILVDAGVLVVTDEGLLTSVSDQAAVVMTDGPSPGAQQLVSGFQANTTFMRFTRFLHWQLMADDGVAYIELTDLNGSPS